MPRPKSDFEDLRSLEFREPAEVLESDAMYTIYEVGRLLQGLDADAELDVETENVLLDWAIPWMIAHSEAFVFAEPADDSEPGYYGLAPSADGDGAGTEAGDRDGNRGERDS